MARKDQGRATRRGREGIGRTTLSAIRRVVVGVEPCQPLSLLGPAQSALSVIGKPEVPVAVPAAEHVILPHLEQPITAVLAHRLGQPVAAAALRVVDRH